MPRLPSSRMYLIAPRRSPTALPSERAITPQADAEEHSGEDHESDRPDQLAQQHEPELGPLHLPQKYHGREVGHVLERQELQQEEPRLWEQIQRHHLARDEEVQGHHDV